ncbi:MAG: HAD-IC family P-type ATPase [Christensenellales bacterium]
MTKKQKKTLYRILISAVLLCVAVWAPLEGIIKLAAFIVPYVVIGGDVLWKAIRNIAHGQVFDENFLMALATIGAFGTGEWPEAVTVMLFYQVGELFQSYAVGRSRRSISQLMDIRPDYANIEKDGALVQVDPDEVSIGQTIVIKAGERIPLDGIVLQGNSEVDTAALTGESLPRQVAPGDNVISGCINKTGLLHVKTTKEFGESTVANFGFGGKCQLKSKGGKLIKKFARYYTPCVVAAAVLLAFVPPLFVGQWSMWIQRALIFLVISCPCALVISVPLSFFGGIGGASKCGILVKGGNYLEVLAETKTMVFDKTGTLTKGVFNVTAVHPESCDKAKLLEMAAYAESYSDHPISRSLKKRMGKRYRPSA